MIVIDTNVIAVANHQFEDIGDECIEASKDFLVNAMKSREKILVDNDLLIISEYQNYANRSGQPRVGDIFFKWLWNNAYTGKKEIQVEITPSDDANFLFEDIPKHDDLIGFDKSDQKFLAVALKVEPKATIVNSSDSDWTEFGEAIQSLGVDIKQLC